MTAVILDGKAIAAEIQHELKQEILPRTKLAVILVGENPASKVYVQKKHEACKAIGIETVLYQPADLYELLVTLDGLSEQNGVHGILLQLPLPEEYQSVQHEIFARIDPMKDVDVFHPENIGLLVQGHPRFKPCTPHGIQQLLKRHGISVAGKHVVIMNRSDIVGKPLSSLLIQDNDDYANATVTVCHNRSDQEAMKCISASADIVVVAVGQPGFLTPDMVKPGATVIDVAINRIGEKKIVGDCDPAVRDVAGYITPVPGGVGPLTVAMLLHNTVLARKISS
jgi:methylenetetrahydrofolate dehydrogenase (NADP+) / methenyltetrahydrofolate cyclohydrolase